MIRSEPVNNQQLNVSGLESFNVIQAFLYQNSIWRIDDMIKCAEGSFEQVSRETLGNISLSPQMTTESAMS